VSNKQKREVAYGHHLSNMPNYYVLNDVRTILFLLPEQGNNFNKLRKLLASHSEVTVQLHTKFCFYEVGWECAAYLFDVADIFLLYDFWNNKIANATTYL